MSLPETQLSPDPEVRGPWTDDRRGDLHSATQMTAWRSSTRRTPCWPPSGHFQQTAGAVLAASGCGFESTEVGPTEHNPNRVVEIEGPQLTIAQPGLPRLNGP